MMTEIANFTVAALADATIVENTPHTTLAPTTAGEDPMGVLTWTLGGPDAAQFSIDSALLESLVWRARTLRTPRMPIATTPICSP